MMNNLSSGRVVITRNGIEIGEINCIEAMVKYDSKAKVKRAAQFKCIDEPKMKKHKGKKYEFNKLKDRIKVYLHEEGIEKSLGVFMILSSPKTSDGKCDEYDFECYDEAMKLEQNQIGDRLFFKAGTLYLTAINQILVEKGFTLIIQDDTDSKLLTDREWSAGSNILDIVNELLKEINFCEFHINCDGYVMLVKKKTKYAPDFIYKSSEASIIPPIKYDFDIYNVPNVFIGIVSNPDMDVMKCKMVNDRMDSLVSTVNRGDEITKVYHLNNIASQDELNEFIKNEYNNSLQQTDIVQFESENQANHEFESCVQLETENSQGLFTEVEWSINLGVKGNMQHKIERKVFI
ncbi:MAG: hypothetical protein RR738_04875 [Anaerorhabdus sp.]|uniref:hypothetical protein n=1 Tax=Anaerorhabdus sp. TaxID=1872524 RepID=UPI002FCAE939